MRLPRKVSINIYQSPEMAERIVETGRAGFRWSPLENTHFRGVWLQIGCIGMPLAV